MKFDTKDWRSRRALEPEGVLRAMMAGTLMLLALPPAAQSQAPAELDFGGVREVVRQYLDTNGVASVSIALAQEGEILWEESFGWADRSGRRKATPHTMYSLASISKPMTATAIMQLHEQGKLDIDRPINDYLEVPLTSAGGDATAVTVRHVLTHTAGLPLHYEFFYEDVAYRARSMTESVARYGIVTSEPGRYYQYSNIGYGILEEVIARVSGIPFADYARVHIFAPLGLHRTSVHLDPGADSIAAVRYFSDQRTVPFYRFDHDGASAIWSSAHDLVRFGMFHIGNPTRHQGSVLTEESRAAMQRIGTPGSSESGYGLGWSIDHDDHGFLRVAHSGGMPGVSTALHMYPSEGLVVAVLTNGRGNAGSIASEVIGTVLPRYEERRVQAASAQSGSQAANSSAPTADLTPIVGSWSGDLVTYQGNVPIEVTILERGDVHVHIEGQLATLLNDVAYEDENLRGRFAGFIPTKDALRQRHSVFLNLRVSDDGGLVGQATAQAGFDERNYFALTSAVRMSRK